MKRILLVSPARGSDFPRRQDRPMNDELGLPSAVMPPLDLATIAALTPPEFHVDIWDESVRGELTDETDVGGDYDLLGVTAYMTHIPWAQRMGGWGRRRGMLTAIGGPGVSGAPERCRGLYDIIFIGEAEFTWPEFLRDWQDGRSRAEYRQVQRPDINESPLPRWTGFENMSRDYLMGAIQTTRGCPFDCDFCDVIHLFGRQPRHKKIETILDEVRSMERLGMRMVFFCDDNFIGRPKYAKDLLRELVKLNNSFERPLGFTTQLTINLADDDEMLELIADANFHWVLIGIESPREACLREANKPQNYKINLVEAVRKVQSYGVLVKGNMIVGFDHDDLAIFDETYDFLRECGILNVGISLLKAYPGTPLLARLQKEGRIIETGDDIYSDVTRVMTNIIPKQLSRVELFEGYKRLFLKLRSWEYVHHCAHKILDNLTHAPKVERKAAPDPQRLAVVKRAIESLEPDVHAMVVSILQKTWTKAPVMMERIISTLFRFGGNAMVLERVIGVLEERIRVESMPDFQPAILRTNPPIPENFREVIQWEAFPLTYERLIQGVTDKRLVPAGLIEIWKSFLIRWGENFERLEDYHFEHLRELCERTIEQANSGMLNRDRVNAVVDGLSRTQLRRLAGEVLVSVEQDLRGAAPMPTVALKIG